MDGSDGIEWVLWRGELKSWFIATRMAVGGMIVFGAPLAWLTFESMMWVAMRGSPDDELGEVVQTLLSWGVNWWTLLLGLAGLTLFTRLASIPIPRTRGEIEKDSTVSLEYLRRDAPDNRKELWFLCVAGAFSGFLSIVVAMALLGGSTLYLTLVGIAVACGLLGRFVWTSYLSADRDDELIPEVEYEDIREYCQLHPDAKAALFRSFGEKPRLTNGMPADVRGVLIDSTASPSGSPKKMIKD